MFRKLQDFDNLVDIRLENEQNIKDKGERIIEEQNVRENADDNANKQMISQMTMREIPQKNIQDNQMVFEEIEWEEENDIVTEQKKLDLYNNLRTSSSYLEELFNLIL